MAKENDKIRADMLVVIQGLAASREKARAMIMAGQVFAEDRRIDKAGQLISKDIVLSAKGQALPYVSRGGLKLAKALDLFPLTMTGAVVLDIGASTGGFTDCALQNGAAKVYAVDVGYGQLDWRLRQDPRVVVMEKTNARFLTRESLGEAVDGVTIDVAFISLDKILPVLSSLLQETAWGIALIKPQFEAGREKVGKKGVVRDPSVHAQVLIKIGHDLEKAGLTPQGLTYSPIKGPEGNIEYLVWFCPDRSGLTKEKALEKALFAPPAVQALVEEAFALLTGDTEKKGRENCDAENWFSNQ